MFSVTVPLPVDADCEPTVIHGACDTADHGQLESVETLTVSAPPACEIELLSGESVYVQPRCVTVNVLSAIVSVPVRVAPLLCVKE